MDYVNQVEHLLTLLNSFSGLPEVNCVPDKRTATIQQILSIIL